MWKATAAYNFFPTESSGFASFFLTHVAHNLNKARKARDGNKKKKNTTTPEQLKIGDNVLVRDHTSKAFQPKYKDFCIVGLLGKNQIEIKDNHGHTTKVHCREMEGKQS